MMVYKSHRAKVVDVFGAVGAKIGVSSEPYFGFAAVLLHYLFRSFAPSLFLSVPLFSSDRLFGVQTSNSRE